MALEYDWSGDIDVDTATLRSFITTCYGPDGVVFASDWENWTENSEVAPLLSQFESRILPQPLL